MRERHRFSDWLTIDQGLAEAACITVRQALAVQEGERVLVITNPTGEVTQITHALHDAVVDAGGTPILVFQPVKGQLDFAEDEIYAAMDTRPQVVISMSHLKIGKDRQSAADPIHVDQARYTSRYHWLLGTGRSRGFWSPAATVEMYKRAVPIDYGRLKRETLAVKNVLNAAEEVQITTAGGTDLTIGLRNRRAMVDDGDFSTPGAGGNLPAGEVYISPELGRSEGRLVFDGSMATHSGTIVLDHAIHTRVEKGFIVDIVGGQEAARLQESVELAAQNAFELESQGQLETGQAAHYARNTRNLGELGIGLNPAALITGRMLEDEKAYRTCHIAIGSNYDRDAPSLIHLDGLLREPTIVAVTADGSETTILDRGDLCVD